MRFRPLFAAATAIAIVACSGSRQPQPVDSGMPRDSAPDMAATTDANVLLRVDGARYAPGGEVRFTLVNRGATALGYNPCSSRSVERREGASWAAIPEPGRMCTQEIRLLARGDSVSATLTLPEGLSAGEYRLVFTMRRDGEAEAAASPPVRAVSLPFTIGR